MDHHQENGEELIIEPEELIEGTTPQEMVTTEQEKETEEGVEEIDVQETSDEIGEDHD
jgi:hypothetical protein